MSSAVLSSVSDPTLRAAAPRPSGSGRLPPVAPMAYERAAERLRGQGCVVVFADYPGRRGSKRCGGGRISRSDAGKDIVRATWLKARISALGWSWGRGAVLAALAEHGQDRSGFSRAVVDYPICQGLRPWRNATPVLMLLAGADEVGPGDACEEVARSGAAPHAGSSPA